MEGFGVWCDDLHECKCSSLVYLRVSVSTCTCNLMKAQQMGVVRRMAEQRVCMWRVKPTNALSVKK